MPDTTRSEIGWEYDSDGRPTEFKESETETRTEQMWHVAGVADMTGPECTMTVTKQRTLVTWQRSRICTYRAIVHVVRAYGKATVSGVLFAGAAFLVAAGAVAATGGAALVAGGALLATGGGFFFKDAQDDLKVKKGKRSCPPFPAWTMSSTRSLGSPIVEKHTIPCGRPITGGDRWVPVKDDPTSIGASPDVAVVVSESISIQVGSD